MIKKYLSASALVLVLVLAGGCASMSGALTTQEGLYVANFTYTPDSSVTANASEAVFIIGNTAFLADTQDTNPWFRNPQFANLDKALKNDLANLLKAKGFSVRGPFDSYDLIPYQDKKAVDFILTPEVSILDGTKNTKDDYGDVLLTTHMSAGDKEISGTIIFKLREIMTGELLWSKTIPIKKIEYSYSVCFPLSGDTTGYFNVVNNTFAKQLEKQYPELLAGLAKLIDPEEMAALKKTARELKDKKSGK